MYTRAQYMAHECTHEQYYAQYVTDATKLLVKRTFGINHLKNEYAKDVHFNTIQLSSWDTLYYWISVYTIKELMIANGDYMTPAGAVCIAKEAARQLVTEA